MATIYIERANLLSLAVDKETMYNVVNFLVLWCSALYLSTIENKNYEVLCCMRVVGLVVQSSV